jgi:short-subunit dehydrogenase
MENSTVHSTTIVITGASSGVGRAMAEELARQGARLVLAARRLQALEETAEACRQWGATVKIVETDTREYEQVAALAREAAAWGGAIDVWINNAGVLAAGELDHIPADVNEAVVRTNLLGYMHGAHAVLPYFKQQGRGILINNISVGGWFPVPYGVAYSASKFGLRGFSDALKAELSPYRHIHVCDLYPAFLDTPGVQHAANYTGKNIMPAPPVYDPLQVARAVVRLVKNPRPKTTIGVTAPLLKTAYHLFPRLSGYITAAFMRAYFHKASPIAVTPGNVRIPVAYGTGIYGGWRNTLPVQRMSGTNKKLLLAAGLLVVSGWLITRLRR